MDIGTLTGCTFGQSTCGPTDVGWLAGAVAGLADVWRRLAAGNITGCRGTPLRLCAHYDQCSGDKPDRETPGPAGSDQPRCDRDVPKRPDHSDRGAQGKELIARRALSPF
jgi:hypothetical protein